MSLLEPQSTRRHFTFTGFQLHGWSREITIMFFICSGIACARVIRYVRSRAHRSNSTEKENRKCDKGEMCTPKNVIASTELQRIRITPARQLFCGFRSDIYAVSDQRPFPPSFRTRRRSCRRRRRLITNVAYDNTRDHHFRYTICRSRK